MTEYKTVYELLEDPNRWCKQYMALNSKLNPTGCRNEDAICWCGMGAIIKVYKTQDEIDKIIDKVCKEVGHRSITYWNDCNSHNNVYNVFKKLGI
ncbi:hypothetical protein C4577_02200 [Candidatus Parcubacteria bacterium]|nr:MAG: hypothetical protein C4577_02200 [Candidatus Parcubacteria bacterium]